MTIENFENWNKSAHEYYVIDMSAKAKNDAEEPTRPARRHRRCECYGPFETFEQAEGWANSAMPGTEVCIGYRKVPRVVLGERWTVP